MKSTMTLRPRPPKIAEPTTCPWCGRPRSGRGRCQGIETCPLTKFTEIAAVSDAIRRVEHAEPSFRRTYYRGAVWDGRTRPGWEDGVAGVIWADNVQDGKFFCPYCQKEHREEDLQIDHDTPWKTYIKNAVGPALYAGEMPLYIVTALYNDPNNLVAACASCNESKGDRPVTDAWLRERRR